MSADVADLPLDELQSMRMRARRALELARLRTRQSGPATAGDSDGAGTADLAGLETQVTALTDELIARYAADLSLVDSLLGEAYPAQVTRKAAP